MMSEAAVLFSVKAVFAGAAILAILWFVLRPIWKMLRSSPDPEFLNPMAYLPDEEMEEELEIPTGMGAKPDRDTLLNQARADPRQTALAITRWLQEKK